jgi:thiol-disulfide isomerase/thioredoxin
MDVLSLDEHRLADVIKAARKPYVVVNFYATWCKPCIKEMPELLSLHNDPSGAASVVFVSLDDFPEGNTSSSEKLAGFLTKQGIDFPSYHYNNELAREFIQRVYPDWNLSIPLNFIYAQDGRLIEKTGMTDKSELELIINQDKVFFSRD